MGNDLRNNENSSYLNVLNIQLNRKNLNNLNFDIYKDLCSFDSGNLVKMHLFNVNKICYREKKNLIFSMENYIKTCYRLDIPFIYILLARQGDIYLYYGMFHEYETFFEKRRTLSAAFSSFFPGCTTEVIEDTDAIQKMLQDFPNKKVILGIPDAKYNRNDKNNDSLQVEFGIERIADAANDNDFALVVTAFPLNREKINSYQGNISATLNTLHPFTKYSMQASYATQSGVTRGSSINFSTGTSQGENHSSSMSQINRDGNVISRIASDTSRWFSGGVVSTQNFSEQNGVQKNFSKNAGISENIADNNAETVTSGMTSEAISKEAQFLESLMDKLYKRTQDSMGEGMWNTVCTIMAEDDGTVHMLGDVFQGLMSGPESFPDPLRCFDVPSVFNPFQVLRISPPGIQKLGEAYEGLSTWLTSAELSRYVGLPLHDMPGLDVQELVEYARFLPVSFKEEKAIELGCTLDRGRETGRPFIVPLSRLNCHCFVTGATGSGKSTTIRSMLIELWQKQGIPFLVIDPVKTEYEELKKYIPELQVYTLGKNNNDFTLNPFSFETAVGLTPHIDYLKAAFNASLGMYSSMPYILEDIIYKAYADCGWDLHTGTNPAYEACKDLIDAPGDKLKELFLPTLSMLVPMVEQAIATFFPNATDYSGSLLGAIRSRLSSMTRGAKGDVLDRRFSTSWEALLQRPCVLELWPFADNEEKGFVMSLLLLKLFEYRQAGILRSSRSELRHVLVIEEAHRLLAKPKGGSETKGSGREKGVEVFADMLAEIRSFGQGLIIADQIPAKLIDDIVKNTDIKIAHRILARDDKESLSSCMLLDKKQTADLARLHRGVASVFFEGMEKPAQVKIIPAESRYAEFSMHNGKDYINNNLLCKHVFCDTTIPVKLDKIQQQVWIEHIRRLGTLMLLLSPGELLTLREESIFLAESFEHKKLGPCLSEGMCLLMDKLDDLGNIPRIWSTRLCCALYQALFKWLGKEDFEMAWTRLRKLSLHYGLWCMQEKQDGTLDFADELIRMFVRSHQDVFQFDMVTALQSCLHTEQVTTEVQDALLKYIIKMYDGIDVSPWLKAESGIRLLTKVCSNDDTICEAVKSYINILKDVERKFIEPEKDEAYVW